MRRGMIGVVSVSLKALHHKDLGVRGHKFPSSVRSADSQGPVSAGLCLFVGIGKKAAAYYRRVAVSHQPRLEPQATRTSSGRSLANFDTATLIPCRGSSPIHQMLLKPP